MLPGRTPTRAEKEWLDKCAQVGCIICLEWLGVQSPAEIHHIDGKTRPGAHFKTLPLCPRHHRITGQGYVSRADGKKLFESAYAAEKELLGMVKLRVERIERLTV